MSDDAQRAQDRARFSLQGKALADLGQQVVRARAENRELRRRLASVEAVLKAVVPHVEACEGALRFYADLQSYHTGDGPAMPVLLDMPILDDCGFKARAVLYKARETKDTP